MLLCLMSGWGIKAQETEIYNPNVKEIIVICKTHFDIGYTHTVEDMVKSCRTTMVDEALQVIDSFQYEPEQYQFAWTLPGWIAYKTLEDWPGQDAGRKEKLDKAFASGQILTHTLPFTMESDGCEPEELTRGLWFSSHLARKYNLPLFRSGKQTDVPSHGGAFATVLANAGVKFLHIGCNMPSGYMHIPSLFWWEGPDKKRVLTFYSPVYGTSTNMFYATDWKAPSDLMVGKNLLPPRNWPYQVWPAILVTMDNSGAPTKTQIKALFDEVHQKMPGVKVRMGTMDDFYDVLMKENPDLPVVKEEMPDTWIHGIMSDPGGVALSRKAKTLLPAAEILRSELPLWGVSSSSDMYSAVDTAYENLLLFGEHTNGRSLKVYDYGDAFRNASKQVCDELEASWEDKTDYARKAFTISDSINTLDMALLANSVKAKDSSYVVYNPLPWKRAERVELDGKYVWMKELPPCGYRVYPIKKGHEEKRLLSQNKIENEYFRITFDPNKGFITSLYDKKNKREWVDSTHAVGLGQYINERFTLEQTEAYARAYQRPHTNLHPGLYKPGMISEKEVSYCVNAPKGGKLTVMEVGNTQMAELALPKDPARHLPGILLRVTLTKHVPFIDMEITIQDKAKDNWPEADWLCLPFHVDKPKFRVYRPLGVMEPEKILPGANRYLYAVGNGVTITDADGAGIAVCPLDHPLISLDTMGCWKYSDDFVPKKPIVYLNLYNNQWNTNFRYWYPGTWSSKVRIWSLNKEKSEKENSDYFVRSALEARNPVGVAIAGNRKGTVSSKQSGIEVSRTGVLVTAFRPDPEGNEGILLRLWEQAGNSGMLTLNLPKGMDVTKAIPVNLRGEIEGEPLPVEQGQIRFELDAFAPASFILK